MKKIYHFLGSIVTLLLVLQILDEILELVPLITAKTSNNGISLPVIPYVTSSLITIGWLSLIIAGIFYILKGIYLKLRKQKEKTSNIGGLLIYRGLTALMFAFIFYVILELTAGLYGITIQLSHDVQF